MCEIILIRGLEEEKNKYFIQNNFKLDEYQPKCLDLFEIHKAIFKSLISKFSPSLITNITQVKPQPAIRPSIRPRIKADFQVIFE